MWNVWKDGAIKQACLEWQDYYGINLRLFKQDSETPRYGIEMNQTEKTWLTMTQN